MCGFMDFTKTPSVRVQAIPMLYVKAVLLQFRFDLQQVFMCCVYAFFPAVTVRAEIGKNRMHPSKFPSLFQNLQHDI